MTATIKTEKSSRSYIINQNILNVLISCEDATANQNIAKFDSCIATITRTRLLYVPKCHEPHFMKQQNPSDIDEEENKT